MMRDRSSGRCLALIAVAAISIVSSGLLAVNSYIFVPNYRFRPVCSEIGFAGGLFEIEGKQTEDFRGLIVRVLRSYGYRVDREGTIYIPRWAIWFEKELLWNYTTGIAAELTRKKQIEAGLVPQAEADLRNGSDCRMVTDIAIEN